MSALETPGSTSPPAEGTPQHAEGRFFADYLNLVAGRYFGVFLGIFRGIFVPRLLDPASYGIYKAFLIIPTYVRAAHLGAVSGLSRQIPFYRGEENPKSLRASIRVAYTFSLGSALLSAIAIVIYSFTLPQPSMRYALWIFVGYVIAGQQIKLQETYLLGHQKFVAVSRLNIIQTIYSTALAIGGAWAFGLMGVIIATVIDGVVTLFLYRRASGIGFPGLSFDPVVAKELLSIGFPLLMTGLLTNVMTSIDKLIVLSFLGAQQLGYYSLAASFVLYINDLSNLLSRVLFPRIVVKLGAGESHDQIKRFVHLPVTAISYVFPVFAIWTHYFCVWGFKFVFPRYEPAAAVMEILTFSILPYSHFLSHMNLVSAVKRQMGMVWMYPVSIGVTAAVALLSVHYGWGLNGVSAGATAGMFLFSVQLYFYSERRILGEANPWPRFFRSYGPTVFVGLIVFWDRAVQPMTGDPSIVRSILRAVVVTAAYVPIVIWAWRSDTEFRDLVLTARRFRRSVATQ